MMTSEALHMLTGSGTIENGKFCFPAEFLLLTPLTRKCVQKHIVVEIRSL